MYPVVQDEALAITRTDTPLQAAAHLLRQGCLFVVITSAARGADLMYLRGALDTEAEKEGGVEDGVNGIGVIHQDVYVVQVRWGGGGGDREMCRAQPMLIDVIYSCHAGYGRYDWSW